WQEKDGPVYITEGPSDVLALTALNLAAIGRPSNVGGVEHLARLLSDVPADRPIIVGGGVGREARWRLAGPRWRHQGGARTAPALGPSRPVGTPPQGPQGRAGLGAGAETGPHRPGLLALCWRAAARRAGESLPAGHRRHGAGRQRGPTA